MSLYYTTVSPNYYIENLLFDMVRYEKKFLEFTLRVSYDKTIGIARIIRIEINKQIPFY